MRCKIVLMAVLAVAVLLTGCEQASVSSPNPTQSEPAVSTSEPVSSFGPGQSEPTASVSEPVPSSEPSQSEPVVSASLPASDIPEEPSQIPVDSGATIGEDRFLAACDGADWSWFDDAVFIGDSVSFGLQNYVIAQRKNDPGFFGGAQFLTSLSLGSGNAL